MYAKVELDRLYENLQRGLEDMELFTEYISQFLAKNKNKIFFEFFDQKPLKSPNPLPV